MYEHKVLDIKVMKSQSIGKYFLDFKNSTWNLIKVKIVNIYNYSE